MGTVETSTYPALTIEWAPGVGAGTIPGAWSDITTYVMGGTTQRGRQYELDRFAAGTCTLSLNAQTRIFDPEWTSGTYFGQLLPMAQIRITAVWSTVTYPVFYGYITDWGQTVLADDNTFWTTIQAVDGFVLLERFQLPSSAWALEVLQDDPDLWFRLGETDTSRVTDSSDGGNYGLFDNVDQGAEGLVPNDADGAVEIPNDGTAGDMRVTIQNPSLISGYPFTVTALFKLPSNTAFFRGLFLSAVDIRDGNPGLMMAVGHTAGGYADKFRFSVLNGGSQFDVIPDTLVADDRVHHVACVATSTNAYVYLDGVQAATVAHAVTWPGDAPNGYTIGNYTDVLFGAYGFRGVIDEVCVWNGTALTAPQVLAQSLAAKTGWDGDDTGARVTRFLDAINWPATLRTISAGISTLGPASWSAGTSALSVLQDWADTEYGRFHMSTDGKIVWKSRHARYLDAAAVTSQATFGDTTSGQALKYVADGFELTRDEALIRNPVTASRAGGVTVTVKDQTLIDNKYWYMNWSAPPTQDQKDSAVRDRAVWLLARYKETATRVKSMRVKPRANPSGLWPQVLGRELGDRITVKRTPLATGNQTSIDVWIESVRHEFSPTQWATTWAGSPCETQAYMVLDSTPLGVLNTNTAAY